MQRGVTLRGGMKRKKRTVGGGGRLRGGYGRGEGEIRYSRGVWTGAQPASNTEGQSRTPGVTQKVHEIQCND
jgi:hypothetical protein